MKEYMKHFFNGKYHKLDGPATVWVSGTEYWYKYGKYHRLDDPVAIHADGKEKYYINEEEINLITQ